MGIARGYARLFFDEHCKNQFNGSVLQLGRQTLYFTMNELQQWASLHNVTLCAISPKLSNIPSHAELGLIDDITFFSTLGFSSVQSVDVSDYEGCTYTIDLNYPVPECLHNRFDLIFDGGTIEHIFNLPMVFKNIHSMLKIGGRIIHGSPSTNHVDHGFFMFSPTLFYDYYSLNNYKINTSYVFTYTLKHDVDPWQIFHYEPGVLDKFSLGGFDKGFMLGIWFCAEKTEVSVSGLIPPQGYYRSKASVVGSKQLTFYAQY